MNWIEENAQRYRDEVLCAGMPTCSVSVNTAKSQLATQALYEIDFVWHQRLSQYEFNDAASEFLHSSGKTFDDTNIWYKDGSRKYFSSGEDFMQLLQYADNIKNNAAYEKFYQQYVIKPNADKLLSPHQVTKNAGLEMWDGVKTSASNGMDYLGNKASSIREDSYFLTYPFKFYGSLIGDAWTGGQNQFSHMLDDVSQNPYYFADGIDRAAATWAQGVDAIGGELTPGKSVLDRIYGDDTTSLAWAVGTKDALVPTVSLVAGGSGGKWLSNKAGRIIGWEPNPKLTLSAGGKIAEACKEFCVLICFQ